jgi:hypothetical protein
VRWRASSLHHRSERPRRCWMTAASPAENLASCSYSRPAGVSQRACCGAGVLPVPALRGTLTAQRDLEASVTQQYIVGQFSVLLEDLQLPCGEWLAAVGGCAARSSRVRCRCSRGSRRKP